MLLSSPHISNAMKTPYKQRHENKKDNQLPNCNGTPSEFLLGSILVIFAGTVKNSNLRPIGSLDDHPALAANNVPVIRK